MLRRLGENVAYGVGETKQKKGEQFGNINIDFD